MTILKTNQRIIKVIQSHNDSANGILYNEGTGYKLAEKCVIESELRLAKEGIGGLAHD